MGYNYQQFFWENSNNTTMTAEYCILVGNTVHGKLICEDEAVLWNTVCPYADRYQTELTIEGIDTHQERDRGNMKIEFIEIKPIYYGFSSMKHTYETLTVHPLESLVLKFKRN